MKTRKLVTQLRVPTTALWTQKHELTSHKPQGTMPLTPDLWGLAGQLVLHHVTHGFVPASQPSSLCDDDPDSSPTVLELLLSTGGPLPGTRLARRLCDHDMEVHVMPGLQLTHTPGNPLRSHYAHRASLTPR